jgi:hypothetical protein
VNRAPLSVLRPRLLGTFCHKMIFRSSEKDRPISYACVTLVSCLCTIPSRVQHDKSDEPGTSSREYCEMPKHKWLHPTNLWRFRITGRSPLEVTPPPEQAKHLWRDNGDPEQSLNHSSQMFYLS